jgi:hypothetical protein
MRKEESVRLVKSRCLDQLCSLWQRVDTNKRLGSREREEEEDSNVVVGRNSFPLVHLIQRRGNFCSSSQSVSQSVNKKRDREKKSDVSKVERESEDSEL